MLIKFLASSSFSVMRHNTTGLLNQLPISGVISLVRWRKDDMLYKTWAYFFLGLVAF